MYTGTGESAAISRGVSSLTTYKKKTFSEFKKHLLKKMFYNAYIYQNMIQDYQNVSKIEKMFLIGGCRSGSRG